jgi:hypothetical protein
MIAGYMQTSLFTSDNTSNCVVGLSYIRDYICQQDEDLLIRTIDAQPWMHDLKRRVQHYG